MSAKRAPLPKEPRFAERYLNDANLEKEESREVVNEEKKKEGPFGVDHQ